MIYQAMRRTISTHATPCDTQEMKFLQALLYCPYNERSTTGFVTDDPHSRILPTPVLPLINEPEALPWLGFDELHRLQAQRHRATQPSRRTHGPTYCSNPLFPTTRCRAPQGRWRVLLGCLGEGSKGRGPLRS